MKSLRKIKAIATLKIKMLLGNTSALTGPLMAIGMTLLMRIMYTSLANGDTEVLTRLNAVALDLGISFNIGMGAIMMTALPLAEDKEKYTLRSLMTSSVNGKQFFVGSILPPFVITIIVNVILIFISGVELSTIQFPEFILLTILGSATSCMLGLLIGILSKTQVNANNIMMPFTIVLSLVPTFATFNASLKTFSKYLYTGMFSEMMTTFSLQEEIYRFTIVQIIVLLVGIVVITGLFIYYYKKNVIESA